mmetsp:Transcript_8916/g.54827  ORF Transcript_8916/g.54827 Transcript_8916/m.54827 type:complete len:97 (+) Transcript_8916:2322-2612(+)
MCHSAQVQHHICSRVASRWSECSDAIEKNQAKPKWIHRNCARKRPQLVTGQFRLATTLLVVSELCMIGCIVFLSLAHAMLGVCAIRDENLSVLLWP